MAHVIWKYSLKVISEQVILMPHGARILHVALQGGDPHIWALVNDQVGLPRTGRRLVTLGTGHPIPIGEPIGRYLGTYLLRSDALVFHVFEVTES